MLLFYVQLSGVKMFKLTTKTENKIVGPACYQLLWLLQILILIFCKREFCHMGGNRDDHRTEVEYTAVASFHGNTNHDLESSKCPNNSPHPRPHSQAYSTVQRSPSPYLYAASTHGPSTAGIYYQNLSSWQRAQTVLKVPSERQIYAPSVALMFEMHQI